MYIAIMGYGVVGSGVAEVVNMNKKIIEENSMGESIEVKYILDLRQFPGDRYEKLVTSDFNKILSDPEVKIVVETMGGLNPSYEYVSACLKAGKSVVTSNKELVAAKGYELLKTAEANNVNFMFEASVGGGIPIIRPIFQCLTANEITEVAGILNGTTNFILTKMIEDQMSFDDALVLAQNNGYAERNPSADVDGLDACRKICILAALCFGKHVYPDGVYTEGIRKVTLADVEYAKCWGGVIKLIAYAKKHKNGKISIGVSPAIIKEGHQLASVSDVFNAVLVRGNAVGEVVFYGRGAGKFPTASAVVADVVDCAKHVERRKFIKWDDASENYIEDHSEETASYLIVVSADDVSMVKHIVTKEFGCSSFISRDEGNQNEFAFETGMIKYGELGNILSGIPGAEIKSVIKIMDY